MESLLAHERTIDLFLGTPALEVAAALQQVRDRKQHNRKSRCREAHGFPPGHAGFTASDEIHP